MAELRRIARAARSNIGVNSRVGMTTYQQDLAPEVSAGAPVQPARTSIIVTAGQRRRELFGFESRQISKPAGCRGRVRLQRVIEGGDLFFDRLSHHAARVGWQQAQV